MSQFSSSDEDEDEWLELDLNKPQVPAEEEEEADDLEYLFGDEKATDALTDLDAKPKIHVKPKPDELQLTLDHTKNVSKKRNVRRITARDRKIRYHTHQTHILCLLFHLCTRNAWCSRTEATKSLLKLIPKQLIDALHPPAKKSQALRSRSFIQAVTNIREIWKRTFRITKPGLKKPGYGKLQNELEGTENVSFEAFIKATKSLEGSRDLGAQLLASLYRCAGVDTRLVFSLQPLSFRFVGSSREGGMAPDSAGTSSTLETALSNNSLFDNSFAAFLSASSPEQPVQKRQRLLRPSFSQSPSVSASPSSVSESVPEIRDSPKPVFWIEVFNNALQKWSALDAFGDDAVGKVRAFAPSTNDSLNSMTYVFAADSDGYLKDVTRRYVLHFYKTFQYRVESIPGGTVWLENATKRLRRPNRLYRDRDSIEDGELMQRELSEGIPKNIQDLKIHPLFVLERFLKKHQIIHPKKSCGRINTKKGTELVYPRKYVLSAYSSERWYIKGFVIKPGEQPVKYVTKRQKGEEKRVALYTEEQTKRYTPMPVVANKVPKNGYGNIDLFQPSMLPYGAYHCTHKFALKAAKILDIDFARAVVGFDFERGMGKPRYAGVVISKAFKDALEETAHELLLDYEDEKLSQTRKTALKNWKRLCMGLRIRERVLNEYS